MRLTCPNCGAEYEVPDEVIPTAGRDVQCSNCGDTWFQQHPAALPDEDETLDEDMVSPDPVPPEEPPAPAPDEPEEVEDPYDGEPEPVEEWDEEDDDPAEGEDWDEDDDYDEEEDDPLPATQPTRPARRPLDPAVQSILREEAALADRARSGENLESQPELGLGDPDRPAPTPPSPPIKQKRPDRPKAESDTPEETGSSRRNLLPDIEEINSTLRRKGDGPRSSDLVEDEEVPAERRRGFRSGFLMAIVAIVLCAIVYLQAPRLAQSVPSLAGPLTSYVNMVNRGRVWLDENAQALAEKLDAMSAETPEDTGN